MSLLNRAAVKRAILDIAKRDRPTAGFARVSQQAIDQIEARVRVIIESGVHRHPSRGKTIQDIC